MTDEGRGRSGLIGLCLVLWLVPLAGAAWVGLLSAQAGRLSLAAAAAAGALGLGVVVAWAVRGPHGSWRLPRWGALSRPHWADLATLALIAFAVWRLWPAATPWPAFLDASWYVNAGARIAEDEGLRFDPLPLHVAGQGTAARRQLVTTFRDQREAGLPVPADPSQGFHDVAFAVRDVSETGATPYHPPFFSAWLALWSQVRGVLRTGEGVLPWSVAFLLAAGALARIAFGPVAALAAVALLAVGPAFAYYGRTPFAEIPAGALALAGLAALSQVAARKEVAAGDDEAADNDAAARIATAAGKDEAAGDDASARKDQATREGVERGEVVERGVDPQPLLVALGGLGIGLAALAKAELILLVPVVLLWWIATRRKTGGAAEALALALGLAVPLANAMYLALTTTSLYVALNAGGVLALLRPRLPLLLIAAGVVVVLTAAYLLLRRRQVARTASEGPSWDDDAVAVLRRVAAVAVLVALALAMARMWLASPGAPPSTTAILSWLVTPLGLWAGAAGVAMALEEGRPRTGPLVAVALLAVPTILVVPAITETLSPLYTARRLVPFALPILAVFAGGLAARGVALWPTADGEGTSQRALSGSRGGEAAGRRRRGGGAGRAGRIGNGERRAGRIGNGARRAGRIGNDAAPDRHGRAYALAVIAGTVLVAFNLVVASAPFYRVRSFSGGAALTRSLAGYGDTDDIFLFASILDGSAAGRMAAPLWTLEGRHAAVIGPADVDLDPLARAVDGWVGEDRTVLLLTDPAVDPPPIPGYDSVYIDRESIVTRALAPSPVLPATWRPLEISVAVHELVPVGANP